jgi:4-amino-4-deoxy-L-arabinose transferase-like glycosyltransferase
MMRSPEEHLRLIPRLLVVLILIGVLARIVYWLPKPHDESALAALPDQLEYLRLADNLRSTGELAMIDPRFADTVRAFRLPGYPAWVALLQSHPPSIRIAQALLDGITILATFILARRFVPARFALLAAGFMAFDPGLAYFSGLILSESLFTSIITIAFVCLAWGSPPTQGIASSAQLSTQRRRRRLWWIGVLLLSSACLVRSTALPLAFLAPLISAVSVVRTTSVSPRLPVALSISLLIALVIFPWAIRNRLVTGAWIFTSTNDGFTLYDGAHPDATGASDQSNITTILPPEGLDEIGRDRFLRTLAFDFVRDHPGQFAQLAVKKLARTWYPAPQSAQFGQSMSARVIALSHGVPLLVFAVVGLLVSDLPFRHRLFLIAPAIVISLAVIMAVGSLRYRLPAHPAIAVLAAAGVMTVIRSRTSSVASTDSEQIAHEIHDPRIE